MSTIKQKSLPVTPENQPTITVRRMPWGALCSFLEKFGAALKEIYKDTAEQASLAEVLLKDLPSIIKGSVSLSTFIGANSSGMSEDEFGKLDSLVASEIINAALTLNTDGELKNSLAGIVAKFVAMVPAGAIKAATKSGAVSTPTSSKPDTTPDISTAAQS